MTPCAVANARLVRRVLEGQGMAIRSFAVREQGCD